jgi:hypothetical protein
MPVFKQERAQVPLSGFRTIHLKTDQAERELALSYPG